MDNWTVTQDVVFDKLMQYIPQKDIPKDIGPRPVSDSSKYLDEAYYFLNQTIDSQKVTSISLVSSKRKGVLKKVVIFTKKLMRKLLFWYIEPICKAQTHYNEMNTQFNIKMFYQMQELIEHIDTKLSAHTSKTSVYLEEQLAEYFQKLETLAGQNQSLKQEVDQLEKRIDKYSEEMGTTLGFLKQGCEPNRNEKSEDFWIKTTVAQAGEDSIIAYILMVLGISYQNDFYLDLGANHAKQLSNTYMLYVNGMRGVLVEANPELIPELKFFRNEDIILNKCISTHKQDAMDFYILSGDGLSTTSWEDAQEIMKINPTITLKEKISVDAITVNEILEHYFAKPPLILNIDIEGMEEEILASYDYERYAPLIIIVERVEYNMSLSFAKREDHITEILSQHNYIEYAYTGINSIFINKTRMEEFVYANRI